MTKSHFERLMSSVGTTHAYLVTKYGDNSHLTDDQVVINSQLLTATHIKLDDQVMPNWIDSCTRGVPNSDELTCIR